MLIRVIANQNKILAKQKGCKALASLCQADCDLGPEVLQATEARRRLAADRGALEALAGFLRGPITITIKGVAMATLNQIVWKNDERKQEAPRAGTDKRCFLFFGNDGF